MKSSSTTEKCLSGLAVSIVILLVSAQLVYSMGLSVGVFQVTLATAIVIFAGALVSHFAVKCSLSTAKRPSDDLVGSKKSPHVEIFLSTGAWIGYIERLIFFMGFWLDKYEIIGGWLAFKVASKWEVWGNVVRVADVKKDESSACDLKVRKDWGTWLFTRFIVGTASNVLIAAIVAALIKCGEISK